MFDNTPRPGIDWLRGRYDGYGTSEAPYGGLYVHDCYGNVLCEADSWQSAREFMENDHAY